MKLEIRNEITIMTIILFITIFFVMNITMSSILNRIDDIKKYQENKTSIIEVLGDRG